MYVCVCVCVCVCGVHRMLCTSSHTIAIAPGEEHSLQHRNGNFLADEGLVSVLVERFLVAVSTRIPNNMGRFSTVGKT